MSLHLMKERVKQSGSTLYNEQIKDAQDILAYGFKDDISYNPNIIIYKTETYLPIKMYSQKYSSSYGTTISFLSPHDNPVELGQMLYDIGEYVLGVVAPDIYELRADEMTIEKGADGGLNFVYDGMYINNEDIGKTVFLTKEEAEEKLKELGK